MSTRFELAQLVERRIQSIMQDTRQLHASLIETDMRLESICMENGLIDAKVAVGQICVLLAELGEGETKQDDLPNLPGRIEDQRIPEASGEN